MDMDSNFFPTSWLTLAITKKISQTAEDGTLNVAIAGQRGRHSIELLPLDNTTPWDANDDNLYSKRFVKSTSPDSSEVDDKDFKSGDCHNRTARQRKVAGSKRLIEPANSRDFNYKRPKSSQSFSNQEHFYSSQDAVYVSQNQKPLPTI
ncbi:hypothetical protein BG015_009172 [Linnemannia schmuckeri]|uniref:Uncharacterized protein n=1 Tax=Linnemannia schmuckeri TaxID=64567 RepID=A0A9P5S859_9FUNG|nr:hypothetical protein BG015_009172 [Linnemannia schmuckeri]